MQAVKYIHKYIYKGPDRATMELEIGSDSDSDEIKQYLQGRYIGPTEAVWRLFEYAIHEESPSVIHLAIHLPGEQPVYFPPGIDADALQVRMDTAHTTLMAFFAYNVEHE